MAAYLAPLFFLDAQIGKILDALETSPYSDNTIVVFSSDHGRHLGDKEMVRKGTLWSRSNNVPLIIKAPGVTQPGSALANSSDQSPLVFYQPDSIEVQVDSFVFAVSDGRFLHESAAISLNFSAAPDLALSPELFGGR